MEPTFWLPKVRLVGERLALAAVVTPVPERLTLCVFPGALSVRVTAAVRLPVTGGLKVTLMVHPAPAATLDPQVFVWAKSPGFAPVNAMLEMVRAVLPLLVRVIVWAGLV